MSESLEKAQQAALSCRNLCFIIELLQYVGGFLSKKDLKNNMYCDII